MLPTRIRAVLAPSMSEKTAAMTPTGAAPSSSAPRENSGMIRRKTTKARTGSTIRRRSVRRQTAPDMTRNSPQSAPAPTARKLR